MGEFLDMGHAERYAAAIARLEAEYGRSDVHWRALLLVLTGKEELWEKARPAIDWRAGLADPKKGTARDLSGGLRVLARLAFSLFNSSNRCEVSDLVSGLDDRNFQLAMAAIQRLRRGA